MTRVKTIRILATGAIACTALTASAQAESSPDQERRVELGRSAVHQLLEEDLLPGLSVAVLVGDELVWSEGFGRAQVELEVPVTPESRFRIGSISKTLSSAALGRLVEQGNLDLDLCVQSYVPSFPQKEYEITTRQLAGHLSGIPHYREDEFVNTTHYDGVVAALDKFKDRPLLFEPGTQYHYSSFGWNLIGAVLEAAAGRPFLEVTDSLVFEPLGMNHTVVDRVSEILMGRVSHYGVIAGDLINAPAIDNSDAWPAAGFLSTPEDLVRFGYAFLTDKVLLPETRELLWTSMTTSAGEDTGYGMGWEHAEIAGYAAIGHGGGHVGAAADFWIVPEVRMVIAVTTNANSPNLHSLMPKLVEIFSGG